MRRGTVVSVGRLGQLPDQDAGAGAALQIPTDLPAGEPNAFYMDVVEPQPMPDEPIAFDIAARLLGSHHEVEWAGRRVRQRGFSFDWHRA